LAVNKQNLYEKEPIVSYHINVSIPVRMDSLDHDSHVIQCERGISAWGVLGF
jgi:hypothetical protein